MQEIQALHPITALIVVVGSLLAARSIFWGRIEDWAAGNGAGKASREVKQMAREMLKRRENRMVMRRIQREVGKVTMALVERLSLSSRKAETPPPPEPEPVKLESREERQARLNRERVRRHRANKRKAKGTSK